MVERASAWQRVVPWIALAVRALVSVPLTLFGANRLFGVGSVPALEPFVASQLAFLAPDAAAWFALVAGVLLLAGLATRPMVIALVMVVWVRNGSLFRLGVRDAVLLPLFWLAATGGGRASLDGFFARRTRGRTKVES